METRRSFVKRTLAWLFGLAWLLDPLFSMAGRAMAAASKTLVPKGTPWTDLRTRNPEELDTSELEVTPLPEFGSMGLEDHEVDLVSWRLLIDGHVEKPLSLSYQELLQFPSIERKVLLICPGFCANHGVWKGISAKELLARAQVKQGASHISFQGPSGTYAKTLRVPVADVLSDRVFLAYAVNGADLPRKHGFPLRLVAEGYYGYDWVKYVDKVTIEQIGG
ncbi:MAG: molybdopterin-dependent oxidoreductase [Thermodesulfobacteriota bacterium]